ncbi:MAG TPA: hypothetical protein VGP48_04810 [Stellaceae bacterium]|jgi:hypothetical protein|nr:hypothetical protein [Stellaceae bacterium]
MTQIWDDLGAVDPKVLGGARLQTHHAVQWVARVARANLAPMPDDSQINMGWDGDQAALVSHPLQTKLGVALCFGLRIDTMTLIALRDQTVADQFALDGQTHAAAGAWLDRLAAGAGLALPSGETLPYAIPAHPVGDGVAYSCSLHRREFAALARWFAAGADLIGEIHTGLPPGAASPLRCWPHHFDIATLWTLGEGDPESAPSIGIGLSPGDRYYPQPYFYVSPWPYPSPDRLVPLPTGDWHISDLVAAILTGERIARMHDRRGETRQFLDAAISVARRLLAVP